MDSPNRELTGRPGAKADLPGHGNRQRVKVLVIEDEALIRDIYSEFLTLLGHEADAAADGHEGLARFDPLVHKIVITDFIMPGLTGLEIAAAIQARSPTTPIVLISGSVEPPDEGREGQARLRFLHKPVPFAQFKATLAELVDATGTGR